MNSRLTGVLFSTVMILFVAFYSIYTGVRYFYSPYQTETAFTYTVSDYYRAKAVIIRDEQPLTQQPDASGVLSYVKPDGAVVIPGSVIAKVYADEAHLRSQLQIEQLNREIALLSEAQRTSAQLLGVDTLRAQVGDTVGDIVDAAARRDLENINDVRNRLQLQLGKYRVSTGRDANYAERIAYLKNEGAGLSAELSQPIQSVAINTGGYFCSITDGYETRLTPNFEALALDDYRRAISGTMKAEPTGAIGKVQRGHNWYLAIVVDKNDVGRFTAGAMVELDFNIQGCGNVPASIYRILPDGSGDAVVILRTNYINAALINLRQVDVDISFKSYTGLRIGKQALRYEGQIEGVYVKNGNLISFKPIERIYTAENFVLCVSPVKTEETAGYESIKQFDEVIVKGTDIYDGKIV